MKAISFQTNQCPVSLSCHWSSRLLRVRAVLGTIAACWLLLSACFLVPVVLVSQTPGETAAATASIIIDARKIEGRISPLLYGQFAEFMFEDIKGGLYAELIRDRGFEEVPNAIGLPRFWERYPDDRNDDFALNFHWEDTISYPAARRSEGEAGAHSLQFDVAEGVIQRHGIYQGHIPVRQGLEYRGYLWVKTSDFKGHVTLALEADQTAGGVYAETDINNISGDWKKYEFTLKPAKSDPLARFAILTHGRGRLWVDQVSLLPGDAVDVVRADVFERVKALRPAFVRWPGGNVAQDYHCMWAFGPRDERTTWINLSWKNEPEPSDFGTDEFIQFCRNVGAEPSLTVNVEGRGATAAEAAAWVEYCNGPATSKYGAMRAANGHPRPYQVRDWEIGNEIWGQWVGGHSDAETYGRNYNRYYEAMRAVDPTIRFIAVGDNDMKWNASVLRLAGERIDYLAIHHYYGTDELQGDPLNLMARPLFYENFYQQVAKLINEVAPKHQIKLSINEWNTSLAEQREHSIESALYGARLMNVFERSDNLVAMSAVSDMVNGWPGGVIQASRHGVFVTPTYLVNMIYANHLGASRLGTKVESPTFDTTREGKQVPCLDVVASRSADGRQIFIKAVNTDQMRPLAVRIDLTGVEVATAAEMESVTADSLTAANTFSTPDAVSIKRSPIKAGRSFMIELPKHSIAVITLMAIR
jgi:alpha-N-arabinofuranosidase